MIIIFLGPPGSGKGTYSARIGKLLGMPHISTGNIFREAIKEQNEMGKRVKQYIKRGELVPNDVTINVLKERISKPDCNKGFILDGYPRTRTQAKILDTLVEVDLVINLNIHEKILIKKISARRICVKCGEIYNIADINESINGVKYIMPPMLPKKLGICDKCGGKLIQRKDDRVVVLKNRVNLYRKQTEPLIRFYRKRGIVEDILVNFGSKEGVPIIMKKVAPYMKKT